jgi:hypothetical protein
MIAPRAVRRPVANSVGNRDGPAEAPEIIELLVL